MSGITSHVLDTSRGAPAAGISVILEIHTSDSGEENWTKVGGGTTNSDGRVPDLAKEPIRAGHYRINFQVASYFAAQQTEAFYPVVRIEFAVEDSLQHYHVPLLLNPFGYSTYRGS